MPQTRFRARRAELTDAPENIKSRSQVTVYETDRVAKLGLDFTDYQVLTVRSETARGTAFTAFVTFVDPDGVGHEWMIPGPVVAAIARHMDSLGKKNRRLKAKRVHDSAKLPPGLRIVNGPEIGFQKTG